MLGPPRVCIIRLRLLRAFAMVTSDGWRLYADERFVSCRGFLLPPRQFWRFLRSVLGLGPSMISMILFLHHVSFFVLWPRSPEFKSILSMCSFHSPCVKLWRCHPAALSFLATTPSEEQLYNVSWPSPLLCLLLSLFFLLYFYVELRTSVILPFIYCLMGWRSSTCKRGSLSIFVKPDEKPGQRCDTHLTSFFTYPRKSMQVMYLPRLSTNFSKFVQNRYGLFPIGSFFIIWKEVANPAFVHYSTFFFSP